MDTQYYRNFLALVEAGNMTQAAEFLHITQPTLSKQLRLLEKMYGAKLVVAERGRRIMYLTEAGEVLYRRAKHICGLEDLARQEVMVVLEEVSGPLRISISPGRTERFIQRVLSGFNRKYPRVTFELYEGIVSRQQEELLSGVTDLAVCSAELTQPERFEILFTREEQLMLIGNKDLFEIPASGELTLEEIAEIPVAISGGCAQMLVCEHGDLHDLLHVVCVSTTKHAALAWARTGAAAALIPAEPDEFQPEGMQACRIAYDYVMHKSIIRAVERPLTHVAKVFLEYYSTISPTSRRGGKTGIDKGKKVAAADEL